MNAAATTAIPGTKYRIESIDILRGLIMLLMAIDHTRDFFQKGNPNPVDLSVTTPILFFTRWITHFCAPLFMFLSGISAHLAGTRRTKAQLSVFLIKRGLWLILLEVVLISLILTLDPGYHFVMLLVFWSIGASMVILGLLIWLPLPVIAVIGAVLLFGHDILDYNFITVPKSGTAGVLWNLFFTARGTIDPIDKTHILGDFYPLLPWTALMLLGYAFGKIYTSSFNADRRKRILLNSGMLLIALFIFLRLFNIYGDPAPWAVQKSTALTIISFFNLSKQPPSLLYVCMTLGPGLLMLVLFERVKNRLTRIFIIYGSVPFFYFVLHLFLIRAINVIVFFAMGYTGKDINAGKGFAFGPDGFGFNLLGVYIVWLVVITALYLPCRWFSKYKKTHSQRWLSYL
jgi:uncharacterized membrane protein